MKRIGMVLLGLLLLLVPGVQAGPLSELILFASDPDNYDQIYTVRPDGRDLRRLVRVRADCREPNLSAANGMVVFTLQEGGSWHLYRVDLEGRRLQRLTCTPSDDRHPSWSPDGTQIVFETNRWGSDELAVMDADGGNVRRLTWDQTVNRWPIWSPRGDQIAFVSWRQGSSDVYVMPPDASEDPDRVTINPYADVTPSWAPDGERLVYGTRNHIRAFLAVAALDVEPQRYAVGTQGAIYPTWSPDGRTLLYAARIGGGVGLYTMPAEGGEPRPFPATPPAAVADLVWQRRPLPW